MIKGKALVPNGPELFQTIAAKALCKAIKRERFVKRAVGAMMEGL